MDKTTLKYFWSHFNHLKTETEYLFSYQHGKWSAHKIAKDLERESSGELDESKIVEIATSLKGSQIYIVHNHPTGFPNPSNPDFYHYDYIRALLSFYNLKVEDFLILSNVGYFSFKESGYMKSGPYYQTQIDKEGLVTVPNASIVALDESNYQSVLNLSEQCTEFIFHSTKQFAAIHDFSPSFLVQHKDELSERNVFFRRKTECPNELERLRTINIFLNPIEIYWIAQNEITPLKLEGII